MRESGYIDINLTGEGQSCSSYVLGMSGEHCYSTLRIALHPRFCNCKFLLNFNCEDGTNFTAPFIDYSKIIEYEIPSKILKPGKIIVSIIAVDKSVGKRELAFENTFQVIDSVADELFEGDDAYELFMLLGEATESLKQLSISEESNLSLCAEFSDFIVDENGDILGIDENTPLAF